MTEKPNKLDEYEKELRTPVRLTFHSRKSEPNRRIIDTYEFSYYGEEYSDLFSRKIEEMVESFNSSTEKKYSNGQQKP